MSRKAKAKNMKKRISNLTKYDQCMPDLNKMEFKEYHKKGTLYNSMLEPFIIDDYKLWSLELAVRFCQEHNIRTIYDCVTYYGMRTQPENYECTWEQYQNNK